MGGQERTEVNHVTGEGGSNIGSWDVLNLLWIKFEPKSKPFQSRSKGEIPGWAGREERLSRSKLKRVKRVRYTKVRAIIW